MQYPVLAVNTTRKYKLECGGGVPGACRLVRGLVGRELSGGLFGGLVPFLLHEHGNG